MRVLIFAAVLALGQYVDVNWSLEAVLFLGVWAAMFDLVYLAARWIEVRR